MTQAHKIVVLGAMGAGKSTLVRTVASGGVVDTDVLNSDGGSPQLTTTTAMDYADLDLSNGDRLRLFGAPGQARFGFLWPVLLHGAAGVLLLVDATSDCLGEELQHYLQAVEAAAPSVPVVIGVTKYDLVGDDRMVACARRIAAHRRSLPMIPFDARSGRDGLRVIDVLASELGTAALA